jgi:hypothetical protein
MHRTDRRSRWPRCILVHVHACSYIHVMHPTHSHNIRTITVKDITMKTVVLLLISALQLQLAVSNLTQNKTKLKDVMCDATHACLDGEHCCFNTDGTPAGCCDDGFVCDVPAGTCDLKQENGTVMTSNSEVGRSIALLQKRPQVRC